ncbi:MAG: FHA domain-containing protein [Kofleriaceae bacterium]|nr:MAG: FHA domain-containing protein [Kofleriaceae bacterium]
MSQNLDTATWITPHHGRSSSLSVRRCRLEVVAGADVGTVIELAQPAIVIGRAGGSADLALNDQKVSGLHCELRLEAGGYRLRDLSSTNGTYVRGVRVVEAWLAPGSTIAVGKSAVLFTPLADAVDLPLWGEAGLAGLVGQSPPMRHLFEMIERFARSDATVLVRGETGVGKELIARAIHAASARRSGPFIVVDCGAIAAGLVESALFGHEKGAFTGALKAAQGAFRAAHGGTIFLDELGELPLDLQPKLLRVLQEREVQPVGGEQTIPVDVRVVCGTNRDLAQEVAAGRFREDLLYRLQVVELTVPPLRARKGDIAALADHFLARIAERTKKPPKRLATDAISLCLEHDWPGNVRELEHAIEAAAVYAEGDEILARDLPMAGKVFRKKAEQALDSATSITADGAPRAGLRETLGDIERDRLAETLVACGNNRSRAAKALGMSRGALLRRLKRYGLESHDDAIA